MPEMVASDKPRIAIGSKVTMHFSLHFTSGEEVDSTRGGKPATFVVGDGSLLEGFEDALIGLTAGDADQVTLPAARAFGERNPQNVRVLPKSRFASMDSEHPLEPGLVVSFQAPDGELPGVVKAVYDETVQVDFNHPLSGRDIVFDVSVIKVVNAD